MKNILGDYFNEKSKNVNVKIMRNVTFLLRNLDEERYLYIANFEF